MRSEVNFSMPIKQSYYAHLKESKEHPKNEIIYEFLDDYSYSDSTFSLVHLKKDKKGNTILYVASEKGPGHTETLNKIVKWRISGESQETGHRGGGNKRFIYGHESSKVSLACQINDEEFMRLELSPNDIYELSANSDISEGDFQKTVDRDFIKWASIYDLEEDGAWFTKYLQEIKEEVGSIEYVIRFNLTEVPFEYLDSNKWMEFISTIRMKNYQIPIYFKNELLGEDHFSKYENIDLIGSEHSETDSKKYINMYIDKLGNPYLEHEGKYRDMKNKEVSRSEEWTLHSKITTYRIQKEYFDEEHRNINKINPGNTKYTNEDFYGVYIRMNGKQINFKPLSNVLVPSKSLSALGNSYFRLVMDPVCDNETLDLFITTDTIKAKTRFRDTAKAKAMVKTVVDICKPPKPVNYIPKMPKLGLCYIVYFGRELYKFGMMEDYTKMVGMTNKYLKNSLDKLTEFYDEEVEEEEIEFRPIYFSQPVENVSGLLEKITELFTNDESGEVDIYETSAKETGKYFYLENESYLNEEMIPKIFSFQN